MARVLAVYLFRFIPLVVTGEHLLSSVMIFLAQEIWDGVVRNLPSFSVSPVAQIFGFKLERALENHSRVWNLIFKDQAWAVKAGLNPTLIGSDLKDYYNQRRAAGASYICLCTGPYTRLIPRVFMYRPEHFELLLKCLRPHSFARSTGEIKFKCGITLNISQIRGTTNVVAVPARLISYRSHGYRSNYLLWEDNTHSLGQFDAHGDVRERCYLYLNGWQICVTDPEQHKKDVAIYKVRYAAGEVGMNFNYDSL